MRKKELKAKIETLENELGKVKTRNRVLEEMFIVKNEKISDLEARMKEIAEIIEAYRASF